MPPFQNGLFSETGDITVTLPSSIETPSGPQHLCLIWDDKNIVVGSRLLDTDNLRVNGNVGTFM